MEEASEKGEGPECIVTLEEGLQGATRLLRFTSGPDKEGESAGRPLVGAGNSEREGEGRPPALIEDLQESTLTPFTGSKEITLQLCV